jgi:hypothetical protein
MARWKRLVGEAQRFVEGVLGRSRHSEPERSLRSRHARASRASDAAPTAAAATHTPVSSAPSAARTSTHGISRSRWRRCPLRSRSRTADSRGGLSATSRELWDSLTAPAEHCIRRQAEASTAGLETCASDDDHSSVLRRTRRRLAQAKAGSLSADGLRCRASSKGERKGVRRCAGIHAEAATAATPGLDARGRWGVQLAVAHAGRGSSPPASSSKSSASSASATGRDPRSSRPS